MSTVGLVQSSHDLPAGSQEKKKNLLKGKCHYQVRKINGSIIRSVCQAHLNTRNSCHSHLEEILEAILGSNFIFVPKLNEIFREKNGIMYIQRHPVTQGCRHGRQIVMIK